MSMQRLPLAVRAAAHREAGIRPWRAPGASNARLRSRSLHVPAEFVAHRRQQLVCKRGFAARAEAFVKGGREHRHRYGLIDRGLDGPAPLSGIGDLADKVAEPGVL